MKKFNKGLKVKIISIGLAMAIAVGSIMIYNSKLLSIKSSANNLSESEKMSIQEVDTNDVDFYKEIMELINNLKSKYTVEEKITNLEDLKLLLHQKKDIPEDVNEIMASASDEVLIQFFAEEYQKNIAVITEQVKNLNNVTNSDKEVNTDIQVKHYLNGDFVVRQEKMDDYGMASVLELSDRSEEINRGWKDLGIIESDPEKVKFGDRSHTFKYELKIADVSIITIRFIAYYKVSKDGLTSDKVVDDCSKAHLPSQSLVVTRIEYNDKQATHKGANIDGTVIYNFAGGRGFEVGGFKFPSIASFNIKFNFWITIESMSEKDMSLSYSYHKYTDDTTYFS